MTVIPIAFNQEHKEMLGHSKLLLEEGTMAIKLIRNCMAAATAAIANDSLIFGIGIPKDLFRNK